MTRALALTLVAASAVVPVPIGARPAYHPGPDGTAADPSGLVCTKAGGSRFGVHLELFANRLVVLVPAGIGVAPPRRTDGVYVRGGRCSYPLRTLEPTGVIEVAAGARLTLGRFFDLWGARLEPRGLLSFRGRVLAFVAGRPWRGDPRAIPLSHHAEIVLEVGGFVPPHPRYRFPKGL